MEDRKVHIAGVPDNGTQRCVRCHTNMTPRNPDWLSYWKPGALVSSGRHGQSVVTGEEAAKYRPCGRKKNVSSANWWLPRR